MLKRVLPVFAVLFGLYIAFNFLPKKTSPKAQIGDKIINLEIADTREKITQGLSGRENLPANSGMLFVMGNSKPTFWMKDMLFPIDIIWISTGKVIGIEENASPPENGEYPATYPAPDFVNYVLEVNAGFAKSNGISVGSDFKIF